MDSQFSDIAGVLAVDPDILEVDGNFLKRWRYRGMVDKAKEFHRAYVKKCDEYNTYMDFFEPLSWYLVGCGYGFSKTMKYLSEVRMKLMKRLPRPDDGDDGQGR